MSYERRVEIWEDTCRRFASKPDRASIVYNTPEGRLAPTDITITPNSTIGEAQCASLLARTPRQGATEVKVVPMDCVYAAAAAAALRPHTRICILNMADWTRAGGNVIAGSRAQEEELFRRSDLHKHLHQRYYPMRPLQTVYSRDVLFHRAGPDMDYALIPEQRYDVISAPALVGPKRSEDERRYANAEDAEFMKDKIRQLFVIAYEQGVDTLILSAWGCGAFYCPPYHTAELFREVLTEFDGLIPHVVFAVLGDNYPAFSKTLIV